jgi:hypothetical protein
MNLFSVFLFVFLALFVKDVGAQVTIVDEDNVGVRLSLDKGLFYPNSYCEAPARAKVRDAMRQAMGFTARKLRSDRTLQQRCAQLCEESAPGHCFLGHRECHGWRQLEETSAVGGALADPSFVDPNADGPILENVTGGRFMTTDAVISSAMREKCHQDKDAVVAELRAIAGLENSCKRLLRREVDVACFVL